MSFKLFGVLFEISYIFACALVLFIAYDKTGIIIPLFVSILIHEFAHYIFLKLFKCKVKKVKLLVGTLGIEYSENLKDSEKLISLAAGPFANIIVSLIALNFKNELYFSVNLILAFFNLLPIKGLDGGDILEIFLKRFLPKKTIEIIELIIAILFFIILLFAFLKYGKNLFSNYSLVLFLIYLILPFVLKKLG